MFKMLVVSLAFLMFTAACTKQRDPHFAQGQGENLLSVTEYNGKTFEIKTGGKIVDQKKNFTKAQELEVQSKAIGDNSYSVVEYEVNDPLAKKLLGDTAIVGRPNTQYTGLIKVTENYVKVFKVASADQIPLSESTYAEKMSDGKLAVPLIGYPITSKLTIERAKNDLNEDSSTMIEKGQDSINKATHFKMDMSRGEVFEAVVKTDLFPISYFDGEWYYNETITSAPEEESTNLGFGGAYDQTLTPSTRIKFLSNEGSLKVVNLNIDERLTKKEDVNFKTTMTIPAQWKAFKVSANGTGMNEMPDENIHWSKRQLVELDLGNAKSTLNNEEGRLVSLEVKDDYLSFSVQNKENNLRTRYSFLRVKKSNYKPKQLFKEDKKIFGFFTTEKSVVQNYEMKRQEDYEKNIFISRFNPEGGKIVFNFTKTTPEWVRPAVREAVKVWDDAFKAAGTNLDIVLDESTDVELGDLRYNAINIIENLTSSNLFGFGPSVTDPMSGEIISATTNVHLTPIREALIEEINTYIRMKSGQLNEGVVAGISAQLQMLGNIVTKNVGDKTEVMSDVFPAIKNMKLYVPDEKNPNKFKFSNIDFRKRTAKNAREFDVAIASGNIHSEIEKQCSEVTEYINKLKGSGSTHSEEENKVLDSCSRKIVLTKFKGTLIHEMGHNFGLRHNFMASNDTGNFLPKDKTDGHLVRSSSVMEYTSFNEDRLILPGPYDIAAIRFGYADKVEDKSGQIVSLDITKNILKNIGDKQTNLKPYKFCTDEDVELAVDPMCQRHDAGVTPIEVVRNIIADYHASYQLLNFRRDEMRDISPVRLMIYRASRFFYPLQRFYEEWRMGVARYLGQDEKYLERMTAQEFDQVVTRMSQDPQYADFVKQYKPVADQIFMFFVQIANLENRYCVVANAKTNALDVIELNKVRDQLFFNKGLNVKSCEGATDHFAANGLKLLTETGYHLNTFKYDLSPSAALEPNDVIGTQGDRLMALMMLTSRESLSYTSMAQNFSPSFMDEPLYREYLKNYMIARLSVGISGKSLAKFIKDPELSKALSKQSFPRFSEEQDLVSELIRGVIQGMMIPGKGETSLARLSSVQGIMVRSMTQEIQQQAVVMAQIPGYGIFVVVDKEAKDAIAVVNKFNELTALRNAKKIDLSNKEIIAFTAKFKEIMPSSSEVTNMTVKDLLAKIDLLIPEVKKLSQENLVAIAESIYEINLIKYNEYQLKMMAQQNPEAQKQLDGFLKLKVNDALKEITEKSFTATSDNIDKILAEASARGEYATKNRVELDAQMDILTKTLIMFGSL